MIAISIILAVSVGILTALAFYWQNIIKWIKKAVNKIKEVLNKAVEGTRTFIIKTGEGLKSRAKYYNRNKMTREWEETVYSKPVDETEVPPEILAKIQGQSIDVEISTTEELQLAISA